MKSVLTKAAFLVILVSLLLGCSYSGAAITPPQTTPNLTPKTSFSPSLSPPSVSENPGTQTPTPTKSPSPTPPGSATTTALTGTLQVYFIDVGQGDAILIVAPDGKTILIDGGEADSRVLPYLKKVGLTRLDLLIATHPHSDHIGGLVQVLKSVSVAKVVTNGQPTTTKTYENFLDAIATAKAEYVEVKRGDSLRLGGLTFAVLNPSSVKSDDLNDNSVVLRFVYGKVSFLFTGDAQSQAEAGMSVSSFSPVKANILKVGHHGSRTSSSKQFLALVKPDVAIYSAGKDNPYGHPHAETLAALFAIGAKIYGTDVNGTVVVTTDGSTYKVSPTLGQPRGPPGVQ